MSRDADAIIRLGAELSNQRDRAFDLWTYLPSYRAAVAAHGDYASEFMPSVADVLREASMYICHKLNPTEEQLKDAGEYYRCPCGETHDVEGEEDAP